MNFESLMNKYTNKLFNLYTNIKINYNKLQDISNIKKFISNLNGNYLDLFKFKNNIINDIVFLHKNINLSPTTTKYFKLFNGNKKSNFNMQFILLKNLISVENDNNETAVYSLSKNSKYEITHNILNTKIPDNTYNIFFEKNYTNHYRSIILNQLEQYISKIQLSEGKIFINNISISLLDNDLVYNIGFYIDEYKLFSKLNKNVIINTFQTYFQTIHRNYSNCLMTADGIKDLEKISNRSIFSYTDHRIKSNKNIKYEVFPELNLSDSKFI